MRPYSRGFTLIELLVVIAIIGLLSSIVLASLSTAREKALDAARMSDTKSLETALQMYFNDHGTFPASSGQQSVTVLAGPLSPYIAHIPNDPDPTITWQYESCSSACAQYVLQVYTNGGFCKTGVNYQPSWFSGALKCPF